MALFRQRHAYGGLAITIKQFVLQSTAQELMVGVNGWWRFAWISEIRMLYMWLQHLAIHDSMALLTNASPDYDKPWTIPLRNSYIMVPYRVDEYRVVQTPALLALCLQDSTLGIFTSLFVHCSITDLLKTSGGRPACPPRWYFIQISPVFFRDTEHYDDKFKIQSQTSTPSQFILLYRFCLGRLAF